MVELRWLEYESHSNPQTGEHFSNPSKYRKLQFREGIYQLYGEDYSVPLKEPIWIGGEWYDVPVVAAK